MSVSAVEEARVPSALTPEEIRLIEGYRDKAQAASHDLADGDYPHTMSEDDLSASRSDPRFEAITAKFPTK